MLDLWFSKRVSRQCRGEAYYFRFADDFLACFEHQSDAEDFQRRLKDRLEGFGLELAQEKTRCIEFGRFARESAYKRGEKPEEFTFLGFTHYCGKTRAGILQGQTPHQSQEVGPESAQVQRLGEKGQKGAQKRGDAPAGQSPSDRVSELLRHNG